tara:strand:- start:1130 stop:1861 length:732 start_codon:yes stop_codon:yes gene_type:complete
MKKSMKIVFGLIMLLFIGISFNGYKLKKQFDSVDKTDEYWEFEKQNALTFSNIRIKGGNKIYINIIPGSHSKLHYKDEIKSDFKYSVVDDTLVIDFNQDLFMAKVNQRRRRSYKMLITYKNLNSIMLDDSYLDLGLKSENLEIGVKGFSTLKLGATKVSMDSLLINMSESAVATFRYDDNPIKINSLAAKLIDSTFMDIRSTRIESFLPEIFDKSEMVIGSGINLTKGFLLNQNITVDSSKTK